MMKTFTTNIIILFLSINLCAQDLYVKEGYVDYNDQNIRSIQLHLTPDVNEVRKGFSDWIEENHDIRLNGKRLLFFNREVMIAEEESLPKVSDDYIDLYVKPMEAIDGHSSLAVFAAYSDAKWIDPQTNRSDFEALKDLVINFAGDFVPKYYNDRVEDQKSTITRIEEERVELKEEISKRQQRIEKLEKEINSLRIDIEKRTEQLAEAESKLTLNIRQYEKAKTRVAELEQ